MKKVRAHDDEEFKNNKGGDIELADMRGSLETGNFQTSQKFDLRDDEDIKFTQLGGDGKKQNQSIKLKNNRI